MRVLLSLLPMVGCAVMMLACMGRMGRHKESAGSVPVAEEDVVALRAEVARLRAERAAPAVEQGDG